MVSRSLVVHRATVVLVGGKHRRDVRLRPRSCVLRRGLCRTPCRKVFMFKQLQSVVLQCTSQKHRYHDDIAVRTQKILELRPTRLRDRSSTDLAPKINTNVCWVCTSALARLVVYFAGILSVGHSSPLGHNLRLSSLGGEKITTGRLWWWAWHRSAREIYILLYGCCLC